MGILKFFNLHNFTKLIILILSNAAIIDCLVKCPFYLENDTLVFKECNFVCCIGNTDFQDPCCVYPTTVLSTVVFIFNTTTPTTLNKIAMETNLYWTLFALPFLGFIIIIIIVIVCKKSLKRNKQAYLPTYKKEAKQNVPSVYCHDLFGENVYITGIDKLNQENSKSKTNILNGAPKTQNEDDINKSAVIFKDVSLIDMKVNVTDITKINDDCEHQNKSDDNSNAICEEFNQESKAQIFGDVSITDIDNDEDDAVVLQIETNTIKDLKN